MENPEPRAQYLNVVLRSIDRTALRIPRFQRHFVWGESNVLELLESIRKGYPIGSILTWKVAAKDEYFAGYREDAFPRADESVDSFEVVLDGAQRLSSLYGCLRNPQSDQIYAMYFDLRSDEFAHRSSIRSVDHWHVPMSALFDSRKFLQVQSDVAALEDGDTLLPRALDLYSTFQDYQIPIIALSNADLEDVVEVFRRVNSSGTPLSSVDFVRALTWRSSFDLEETFEKFADRYQGGPLEGLTEEFLVRCLAITAGLSLDARDVLQLENRSRSSGGLKSEVEAMERALDEMSSFMRALSMRQIAEVPYEVQRLLLFGFKYFQAPITDAEMEAWLWLSTFSEEHQSKPESYTSRLIREMRSGNFYAALEVRKKVDTELFASRPRRGGAAVTIGFDLLTRKLGARSLISGEPVEGDVRANLYGRAEIDADPELRVKSVSLLANQVMLTAQDAVIWRNKRAHMSIDMIYEECARDREDAAEIWASQGLGSLLDGPPSSVLNSRSRELLLNVIPADSFD